MTEMRHALESAYQTALEVFIQEFSILLIFFTQVGVSVCRRYCAIIVWYSVHISAGFSTKELKSHWFAFQMDLSLVNVYVTIIYVT